MTNGFTLAEVLITLAIIGIVAVLTIPTLVANYQEKGWNTAATVFERKLEEALKVMNSQGTLAGYKTTEEFVNELQKHLKITKVCKNDDILSCFEDTVFWEIINISHPQQKSEEISVASIKNAKDLGQKDWNTEVLGIQLNNGTNALIAYNPQCRQDQFNNQITGSSCVAVVYDTSGFAMPNTSGKDLRTVNAKLIDCAFKSDHTCFSAPFNPTPYFWKACDAEGNSTNPDDLAIMSQYGITKCFSSDLGIADYWAGAAAACGGQDKLLTRTQLTDIASYIYGTTVSGGMGAITNAKRNDSKASSLGFKVISGSYFRVWSDYEQHFADRAFYRNFDTDYTQWGTATGNRSSQYQAVCITN